MEIKHTRIRKKVYISITVLLILCLGSVKPKMYDWSQCNRDEVNSAYSDTDITPPFVILWEEIIQYQRYKTGDISGTISGSPVASGDRLVFISQWTFKDMPLGPPSTDYILSCFKVDKTGLESLWHQFLPGGYSGATPAIVDNTVVCPSDIMLFCFDLGTGELIWEIKCWGPLVTPTIMSDAKKIAVVTAGGTLSLIDIPSGEIVWRKISVESVQCQFKGIVTSSDGKLFVYYTASGKGEGVAAFNFKGDLLWKHTGKLLHKNVDDNPYITLYTGGILFAVGNPTTLFALDGDTGEILWTYKGKTLLDALSSDGKNIYVYSKTDKGVLCLDVDTGKEFWKSPPLFPGDREFQIIVDKSLVSTQNCVFICRHTFENIGSDQIFALDSATGELVWTSERIDDLKGPLILCSDMLIAKSSTALYAFGQPSQVSPVPPSTPPESTPPNTVPPRTEPSQIPPGPGSSHAPKYLIVVGIIGGILTLMLYMWQKKK